MAAAFEEFGVMPELIKAVEELGWTLPTDIQAEAIPLILGGGDVMAVRTFFKAPSSYIATVALIPSFFAFKSVHVCPGSCRLPRRELARRGYDSPCTRTPKHYMCAGLILIVVALLLRCAGFRSARAADRTRGAARSGHASPDLVVFLIFIFIFIFIFISLH
jgi:hypothetical protein